MLLLPNHYRIFQAWIYKGYSDYTRIGNAVYQYIYR